MKASALKNALSNEVSISKMLRSIYEGDEVPSNASDSTISLTSAVTFKNIISGGPSNTIYTYTITDGASSFLVSFTISDGKPIKVSDTSSGSVSVLYNGAQAKMSTITLAAATLTAFQQTNDLQAAAGQTYNAGEVVKYCIDNKVPGFSSLTGFSA